MFLWKCAVGRDVQHGLVVLPGKKRLKDERMDI